ncbi:hypothetical protein NKG94_34355 [Micromonospora sp. M12]
MGLHTRRAQHVQLIREDLVDETGAVFDPARRRAFLLRTWHARRWSIDHNERDPRRAWRATTLSVPRSVRRREAHPRRAGRRERPGRPGVPPAQAPAGRCAGSPGCRSEAVGAGRPACAVS